MRRLIFSRLNEINNHKLLLIFAVQMPTIRIRTTINLVLKASLLNGRETASMDALVRAT